MTFPLMRPEPWSARRLLKFLCLWLGLAVVPAYVAYAATALFSAWFVRAVGLEPLAYLKVLWNVVRNFMVFEGGLDPLMRHLPTTFAIGAFAAGTLWAASLTHRRPLRDWITTSPRFRWRPLVSGLVLYGGIFAVGLAVQGAVSADGYRPDFGWIDKNPIHLVLFLLCLPPVLVLSAASEEMLFRGWLMQESRTVARSLPVAFVVSALAFAVVHQQFLPARLLQLFVSGLAFSWAAARTGGLEWGIGLHAGGNLAVRLLVDNKGVIFPGEDYDPVAVSKMVLPTNTTPEWVVLIILPLLAIALTEGILRTPRLRSLVGLDASPAAAPKVSI